MKKYKRIFTEVEKKVKDIVNMRVILNSLRSSYDTSLKDAISKARYDSDEQENVDFYRGKLLGIEQFQNEIKYKLVSLQKEDSLSNVDEGIRAALNEIYKMLIDWYFYSKRENK